MCSPSRRRSAFDAVVAPDGADLTGIAARKLVLVGQDGSVWSSA